jgi:hypothetical protein
MRKILVSLAAVALSLATLTPVPAAQAQGQRNSSPPGRFRKAERPIPGQYIVAFKNEVARSAVGQLAEDLALAHGGKITFVYGDAIKGFAVQLPEAAAVALSRHPLVDYVEEDGVYTVNGVETLSPNSSTFWGIDRIDQRDLPLDNTYAYNRVGNGVHAYVLDTGIWITHLDFQGRANVSYDAFGGDGIDRHNHGTFVAGVVGSKTYGVAKNVRLHAVKVCDDSGNCPTSTIVAGLNWVTANHLSPAVANMSFGGAASTSIDNAVRGAINAGVTCVAAAGNGNTDAGGTSPARVWEAITVAATNRYDARASYSNYGWVVDLFAPGGESPDQFIPVPGSGYAYGGRDDIGDGFTGTSAAAPHVTGVAALYLETNPAAAPATVSDAITGNATPDHVSNIPENCTYDWETGEYFCDPTTVNLLLYSGFVPAPASNPIYASTDLFVKQQYWDVQYRDPDADGYSGWTGLIDQCGADETCRQSARVDVGYGNLASSEANDYRSYWIYRYLKTAFGTLPLYDDFNSGMLSISRSTDPTQFLASRDAYAAGFTDRADFHARYDGMSNAAYVDTLSANAGTTLPNRDQLVSDLDTGAKTRADVLREIVESSQVFNSLYNEGWVARCYYLYLRRGPDGGGFNAWMSTLSSTGDYRGIIFGFIYSTEYQGRFM